MGSMHFKSITSSNCIFVKYINVVQISDVVVGMCFLQLIYIVIEYLFLVYWWEIGALDKHLLSFHELLFEEFFSGLFRFKIYCSFFRIARATALRTGILPVETVNTLGNRVTHIQFKVKSSLHIMSNK
jgi:hypothetical protein